MNKVANCLLASGKKNEYCHCLLGSVYYYSYLCYVWHVHVSNMQTVSMQFTRRSTNIEEHLQYGKLITGSHE
ncbi:hypothetical protein JHK82_020090 [Glycine max]|uniref:Uncharacterized protein n=1 Tax=Glycine max TaxID=3847 RepID=K7L4A1_SOYBN|nr:hypothetical protein JHK87_019981 [Glycine soja]KAG5014403.1 hypothetical protein JHK85_020539 [Glycine max]KAG5024192.1 hypothetical protein JHK86_020106 [Glycine max]KAG5135359.1 hypothetical protein JHK82_020090 [Glycine max]KAH1048952.1 hypothetical protein GYH30_019839 [Glycine max]